MKELQILYKHRLVKLLTPTECTIHFGGPVVPEEYIIKSGWLNGTCSNFSRGESSANLRNSDSRMLTNEK